MPRVHGGASGARGAADPGEGRVLFLEEIMAVTEKRTRFEPAGSTFDLPELEHEVLEMWERERSFDVLREKNAAGPLFRFIDGPITANAEAMGIHHAWARTYKDVFQRFWAMKGYEQRYQSGFDCHGPLGGGRRRARPPAPEQAGHRALRRREVSRACRARVDRSAAAFAHHSPRVSQCMDKDKSSPAIRLHERA